MEAFGAPAIAILIFAVLLIWTMVKSVPQGENWTVERFGCYTCTSSPACASPVPLMDRVGRKIGMMGDRPRYRGAGGHHRDNAMVVADAVAFIRSSRPPRRPTRSRIRNWRCGISARPISVPCSAR